MTTYFLTMGLLLALPWALVSMIILGSAAAAVRRWFAASGDRQESWPASLGLAAASPPGLPPAQVRPLPDADPLEEVAGLLVVCHGRGGLPSRGRAHLHNKAPRHRELSRPVLISEGKVHRRCDRRHPCRSDPRRTASSPRRAAALSAASYSPGAAAWFRLHSGPSGIKPWRGELEQCRTAQQREVQVLWRSRAA